MPVDSRQEKPVCRAAWSIKSRVLVAVNALVFGVCLLLGFMVAAISDRVVEQRLLADSAKNAVRLSHRLNLDFSNRLARDLAEILDAEITIWDLRSRELLISSLDPEDPPQAAHKGELKQQGVGSLLLRGQSYKVGFAPVSENRVLAVMMEPHRLAIAQHRMRKGLPWLVLVVAGCASIVSILLARSIHKPVADISSWVNSMAGANPDDQAMRPARPRPLTGPPEICRLAEDVDGLLKRLHKLRETATREEKLAAVGRFSMAIAHELRNPLSGIKMNAQLVARNMQRHTGEVDRGLEMVIAETDRMQFILNELLGLVDGRPEDAQPLPAESCPLEATVGKVLEFMAPRFEGAEVSVDWENNGVHSLPCSRVEFEQVLYNLLGNAVDALPEGGRISLRCSRNPDHGICFAVSDSGTAENLSGDTDVFAPFVTTKKRGAGLGLYVCRKIISRRGGTIAWRRADRRTVFFFTLPDKT